MTDQELLQAIRAIVKEEITPVKLTLDHEIKPAIQKLAEGHENIIEHIDEKIIDHTEEIQNDVDALKAVVKQLTKDVRKLKMAQ